MLILAIEKNQAVPAPYKMALSDDLLIVSFRCAVNGLNADYLRDLIGGMVPFSAKIMSDIREAFGEIPSVMEVLLQEEMRVGLH